MSDQRPQPEYHPNTNTQIKGNKIPCWDDLLKLSDELANTIPEQTIIGWDFALTDKGWVVIEANHKPSFIGIQMCSQKGVRKLLNRALNMN